jgi:hypothetical protein
MPDRLGSYLDELVSEHPRNGAGGIRTPVTRKGKTVFKTVALSRSATAPSYFAYFTTNMPALQEN